MGPHKPAKTTGACVPDPGALAAPAQPASHPESPSARVFLTSRATLSQRLSQPASRSISQPACHSAHSPGLSFSSSASFSARVPSVRVAPRLFRLSRFSVSPGFSASIRRKSAPSSAVMIKRLARSRRTKDLSVWQHTAFAIRARTRSWKPQQDRAASRGHQQGSRRALAHGYELSECLMTPWNLRRTHESHDASPYFVIKRYKWP